MTFLNNVKTVIVTANSWYSRLFLKNEPVNKVVWTIEKDLRKCKLKVSYLLNNIFLHFNEVNVKWNINTKRWKLKLLNLILFRWGQSFGFSIWIGLDLWRDNKLLKNRFSSLCFSWKIYFAKLYFELLKNKSTCDIWWIPKSCFERHLFGFFGVEVAGWH
jgi:hypothetical protein